MAGSHLTGGKVRFAVVGCGAIATEYHLPALTALPGGEFVIACDLIEDRARQAMARFGSRSYTLDYRDILPRADVDLICIFTKVEAHAEIAIAAANAGKHVFTQKPFARNLREGYAMVEAAERNGVLLWTSFMHSYFEESVAAAEWVRSGRLGKIEFVRQRNAPDMLRSIVPAHGGAMMDVGAHGVNLIRSVTGQEIVRVTARVEPDVAAPPWGYAVWQDRLDRPLTGGEPAAFLTYELSGGAVASHEIQWAARGGTLRFQMEIYGTDGSLHLRVPRTGNQLAVALVDHPGADGSPWQWHIPELATCPFGQRHHQALFDAVRARQVEKPGHSGMAVLEVFEAARRSIDLGAWVQVGR